MDRPPPPPNLDFTEDRRYDLIAIPIATWVLAVVAVVLRIASRKIKGVKLWLDDWLILASLVQSSVPSK